jgi:hypothetical protein
MASVFWAHIYRNKVIGLLPHLFAVERRKSLIIEPLDSARKLLGSVHLALGSMPQKKFGAIY